MKDHAASPSLIARDQLIEQHRSYVRALAIKVMQSFSAQVDLQELIAYGTLGLIEAAQRFDARRGVAFSTFAHYRIKGAIYDGLREMGLFSRSANAARARWATNANDLMGAATDDEQAAREGNAPALEDDIAAAQSMIEFLIPAYLLSLDSDEIPEVVDQRALSREQIEQRELIGFVRETLNQLSDDEQQLIASLYFKHVSMTDLAAQLGVTKSWISRLHARAIKHLRERLQERGILASDDES